jgi:hypothetical protein
MRAFPDESTPFMGPWYRHRPFVSVVLEFSFFSHVFPDHVGTIVSIEVAEADFHIGGEGGIFRDPENKTCLFASSVERDIWLVRRPEGVVNMVELGIICLVDGQGEV